MKSGDTWTLPEVLQWIATGRTGREGVGLIGAEAIDDMVGAAGREEDIDAYVEGRASRRNEVEARVRAELQPRFDRLGPLWPVALDALYADSNRPSAWRFRDKRYWFLHAEAALRMAGRRGSLEGCAWVLDNGAWSPIAKEQWRRAGIVPKYISGPDGRQCLVAHLRLDDALYRDCRFSRREVQKLWTGKRGEKSRRHVRRYPENEATFRKYARHRLQKRKLLLTEGQMDTLSGREDQTGMAGIGPKICREIWREEIRRAEAIADCAELVRAARARGPRAEKFCGDLFELDKDGNEINPFK